MADTIPSPSERTSSGALARGVPAPFPPGEHRGEHQREPAAADVLAQARTFGTELAGALRDCAAGLLDEQKARAANEIATLGEVLHRSVQSLERRDGETVVRYAADTARHVSQFADRLHRRPLDALAGDIEDFARRWPIAFVASAIGVGLIAGRLLVSSATRLAEQDPADRAPAERQTTQSSAPDPTSAGEKPLGDTRHDYREDGEIASRGVKSGAAAAARETG